jgi:hypothetical protein
MKKLAIAGLILLSLAACRADVQDDKNCQEDGHDEYGRQCFDPFGRTSGVGAPSKGSKGHGHGGHGHGGHGHGNGGHGSGNGHGSGHGNGHGSGHGNSGGQGNSQGGGNGRS